MKRCLVVGASGTVGTAVVELLETTEWQCLKSSSRQGMDYWIDLTNPDSVAAAAQLMPNLDGIVICSGLEPQQSLTDLQLDHLNRMLAIHVVGPMLLLQAVEYKMNTGASVVFISSAAAYTGSYDPSYAVAKGAQISLVRSVARAWKPRVRVNAVAPSLIEDSPVHKKMTEDFRQRHRDLSMLDRLATADDCAQAVEFLLNHKHMTGSVLHMNGGQYFG